MVAGPLVAFRLNDNNTMIVVKYYSCAYLALGAKEYPLR
jgi:hypothetical protein